MGTTRLFEHAEQFIFIPASWPGFPPQLQQLMNDAQYPSWVNNGRSNQGWQTRYNDLRYQTAARQGSLLDYPERAEDIQSP
ncbi:MAG: hypothetical protein IT389_11440 [Nitrospira sp.]|nr:hypothetical protein [Nitrospira sp.]